MLSRCSVSRFSAVRGSALRAFGATSAASDKFDLVVIGGGPGGYVAAIKAAQLGLKTACVESRGTLGGTCLNVGCIPSKALLHSSHLFDEANHDFAKHGIIVDKVSVDVGQMQKAKSKAVTALTGGIEYLFKKYGVTYLKGKGRIASANSVEVTGATSSTVQTKNILIATGSEVTPLPPVPVNNAEGIIVDSTGALEIKKVPKKMIVIGGGVIGLEMGSVWRRLGSEVTVVEYLDRIIPGTDGEVAKKFLAILKKQGMKFKLGAKVTGSKVVNGSVQLSVEDVKSGAVETLDGDVCLVSIGRRPYTQGLGLAELGIPTDRIGRVEVDKHFRTKVPSIYAIGDVIAGPMLAHKAEEEGIACVESLAGFAGHVNYDAIPGVIYTFPEVAVVGKTEEDLKAAGVSYSVGNFPFSANSRARAVDQSEGFVKILTDKKTDRILGAHIIGPNAGEMISEAVIAMEYGASAEDMARTCHAHPTMSEAFKEACMAAYDKPIHF